MKNFIITDEQIEKIRPYMENIDEVIKQGFEQFLIELDDAIIGELGLDDYNSTPTSEMLQKLYDEILNQN